jgi:hypothetical protein
MSKSLAIVLGVLGIAAAVSACAGEPAAGRFGEPCLGKVDRERLGWSCLTYELVCVDNVCKYPDPTDVPGTRCETSGCAPDLKAPIPQHDDGGTDAVAVDGSDDGGDAAD